MSDLIERLRSDTGGLGMTARLDAADRIEELEEEVAYYKAMEPCGPRCDLAPYPSDLLDREILDRQRIYNAGYEEGYEEGWHRGYECAIDNERGYL